MVVHYILHLSVLILFWILFIGRRWSYNVSLICQYQFFWGHIIFGDGSHTMYPVSVSFNSFLGPTFLRDDRHTIYPAFLSFSSFLETTVLRVDGHTKYPASVSFSFFRDLLYRDTTVIQCILNLSVAFLSVTYSNC